jgi:signal peptidase II
MQTGQARLALVALGVTVADQVTKALAVRGLVHRGSVQVVGDLVRLTLVRNPGVAFGVRFGEWAQLPLALLSAVVVVILVGLLLRRRTGSEPAEVALAAIAGGALGNLVDRLRFGTVVDFLDIGVGSTRWPVFNLADSAVTVGVLYLLLTQLGHRSDAS